MKTIKILLSSNCLRYAKKEGGYGKYYQLTKFKGVKVVKTKSTAIEETCLLKKANLVDFTPKCYGLVEVYFQANKKKKYFGILQEHIEGETDQTGWIEKEQLQEKLRQKTGINHFDLHNKNIITTKEGKHYVIDFTPSWAELV